MSNSSLFLLYVYSSCYVDVLPAPYNLHSILKSAVPRPVQVQSLPCLPGFPSITGRADLLRTLRATWSPSLLCTAIIQWGHSSPTSTQDKQKPNTFKKHSLAYQTSVKISEARQKSGTPGNNWNNPLKRSWRKEPSQSVFPWSNCGEGDLYLTYSRPYTTFLTFVFSLLFLIRNKTSNSIPLFALLLLISQTLWTSILTGLPTLKRAWCQGNAPSVPPFI